MTDDQVEPGVMPADEAADRLAAFSFMESVSREEIAWLLERGELRHYAPGDVVRTPGTPIDDMGIMLTGRVSMYAERLGGWRRVIEVPAGFVMGVVPYSRMRTGPGKLVAEAPTTVLALGQEHFRDLITECHGVTTALVHQMLDRAREFRTIEMHDERLLALGKLASGLAHELNNPAAGASSGARSLVALLAQVEHASRAIAAAPLSDAHLAAIDTLRAQCTRASKERSALEAADREDDFTDWFERHELDPGTAEVLASTDVSLDALNGVAEALPADVLGVAIDWLAAGIAARDTARHIHAATTRIHDLVGSVKGFTFMDREGMPDDVDVAQGLVDTIAMLESKASSKSVDLRTETADDLPRVYGYGSEINQVWQSLIDNAIDAVDTGGSVTVTATVRDGAIVVRVTDNGPGIPAGNISRIFDPFFTTKPVGSGAGLGLYQARRIVDLHNGDIDVSSRPARTVFRVRLPRTGVQKAASSPGK